MTPDKQKLRFRDARGAVQEGQEAPEQEYSRILEQAPQEQEPAMAHEDAADDAMGNHPEPDGDEVPMEGQEALQQRLQGYNASASPGRGIDFNDPELLKFILLKLLESATTEGQEAPQPAPSQGEY